METLDIYGINARGSESVIISDVSRNGQKLIPLRLTFSAGICKEPFFCLVWQANALAQCYVGRNDNPSFSELHGPVASTTL